MHLPRLSLAFAIGTLLVPSLSEAKEFKILHALKARLTRPGVVQSLDGKRLSGGYSLVKTERKKLEILDKQSRSVASVEVESGLLGKARRVHIATKDINPELLQALREDVLKLPVFAGLKSIHFVPPKAIHEAVETLRPGEGHLRHFTSVDGHVPLRGLSEALETHPTVSRWLDTVQAMTDFGDVYVSGVVTAGHYTSRDVTKAGRATWESHIAPGRVNLWDVTIKH